MPGFRHNPSKYRYKLGMSKHILWQAIFISLLGHLTLFGMFSFSFGPKITGVNSSNIAFWGDILRTPDLMKSRIIDLRYKKEGLPGKSEILTFDKINRKNLLLPKDYTKPPVLLTLNQEKMAFAQESNPIPFMTARKGPAIMFYPRLPYHFALYFKDRQTAHIELGFKVVSGDTRNSVLVKRLISSGNLEADLLSMRYISRYLFIQQRGFVPDKWQTVKIDLSTVND